MTQKWSQGSAMPKRTQRTHQKIIKIKKKQNFFREKNFFRKKFFSKKFFSKFLILGHFFEKCMFALGKLGI